MRHILVEMCNHPERNDLDKGFGMLELWDILGADESMKKLLQHYTNPENTEYWTRKIFTAGINGGGGNQTKFIKPFPDNL